MTGPAGIRLSAAVMTHPARIDAARLLRDRHAGLDLQIVCDPEPERKGKNLGAARAAWSCVPAWATHHLVLEDDVILGPGFAERVRAAIEARPGAAISLFAEWGSSTASVLRVAALRGAAFAEVVDHYLPHQAAVLPAAAARGFAEFAVGAARWEPCDVVMLRYLRGADVPSCACLPNLAEHRDLPSLVGRRSSFQGRRSATCFGAGDGPVGRAIIAGLPVVPRLSWVDATASCLVRGPAGREVPGAALLAERGVADPADSAAFRDALAGLGDGPELVQRLGAAALGQLWTAAFLLGLVALGAGPGRPDLADGLVDGPLADGALVTLAPGGLRRLVPPEDLDWLSGRLAPLTRQAVRWAEREVRAGHVAAIG